MDAHYSKFSLIKELEIGSSVNAFRVGNNFLVDFIWQCHSADLLNSLTAQEPTVAPKAHVGKSCRLRYLVI